MLIHANADAQPWSKRNTRNEQKAASKVSPFFRPDSENIFRGSSDLDPQQLKS